MVMLEANKHPLLIRQPDVKRQKEITLWVHKLITQATPTHCNRTHTPTTTAQTGRSGITHTPQIMTATIIPSVGTQHRNGVFCSVGNGAVRYYAHATDNDGNDYIVMWSPSPAWEAAQQEARESNDWSDYPAILDDEGNACDWDNPVDVIPA